MNVIGKRFRKLSLKYHPDKGGDKKVWTELINAYEILKDEDNQQQTQIFRQISVDLQDLYRGCKVTIPYKNRDIFVQIPRFTKHRSTVTKIIDTTACLQLQIHQNPHTIYRLYNGNLYAMFQISLDQALGKKHIYIQYLDGKKRRIHVSRCIQSDTSYKITSPMYDIYIRFKIVLPDFPVPVHKTTKMDVTVTQVSIDWPDK